MSAGMVQAIAESVIAVGVVITGCVFIVRGYAVTEARNVLKFQQDPVNQGFQDKLVKVANHLDGHILNYDVHREDKEQRAARRDSVNNAFLAGGLAAIAVGAGVWLVKRVTGT